MTNKTILCMTYYKKMSLLTRKSCIGFCNDCNSLYKIKIKSIRIFILKKQLIKLQQEVNVIAKSAEGAPFGLKEYLFLSDPPFFPL